MTDHQSPAANHTIPRVNILGVGISVTNLSHAARFLIERARAGRGGYVNICTVHSIIEAQDDPKLRQILNQSLLSTPDGMPLSWIGWASGFKSMDRTYGPDLLLKILRDTEGSGLAHYFYGGNEGVAAELAHRMRQRFPAIGIAGFGMPPFRPLTDDERAELIERLGQSSPAFVWVGISTPKQDRLIAELSPQLPQAIFIGVGAAFDFHTGRVKQAPGWIQRAGLEWFFRLTREPGRLWKRYLHTNPRFIFWYLLQWLGWKKFPLA